MSFLARIIRNILWLIFFAWIVWLVRRVARAALTRESDGRRNSARPGTVVTSKRLLRDPWCGTHVSPEISCTLEDSGQVLHFCSAECRDRYRLSQRRTANG